ncbi:MAG: gliding motility-associated C-terminal domain-containing protein, partial [Bacteroidota bacterium]|nr:gliding motility-associated C-terminal domain-containing protein [Bacteroidota bacterium]
VQVIHFHTTFFGQFAEPSEPAKVVLSALSCEAPLVARVFQPNPLDECNAEEFAIASELWTVSTDTILTTALLLQNTDYVLLLGSSAADCAVDVRLEGLAMSIDACCTSSIDYGESTTVDVLGSDPDLGFDWTPLELAQMVDNQLAELSPFETTTFEVTGYIQGCSYTDAVLVAVGSPIEVPNAFSPNNDASNDTWNIYGLSQFPTSTIEVFDRWGQSVFRSVSYPNPWAGKNRGVDVPAGTYYYVIHLNEPNANLAPVTGHVAVIR